MNKWINELFWHVWLWRQRWGLLCFSSNTSEDGWLVQFSSRQLNLTNSYYWVFIMLYWACHRVREDKASALKDHCPNLTCHLLASCCSWTDGPGSQCHWCPDFRNCLMPLLVPWSPVCLHFRCLPKLCLNLPHLLAWEKNCIMTEFSKGIPIPHCYMPLATGRQAISTKDYIL